MAQKTPYMLAMTLIGIIGIIILGSALDVYDYVEETDECTEDMVLYVDNSTGTPQWMCADLGTLNENITIFQQPLYTIGTDTLAFNMTNISITTNQISNYTPTTDTNETPRTNALYNNITAFLLDTNETTRIEQILTNLTSTYININESEITSIAGTIQGDGTETQHSNANYDGITTNITETASTPGLDLRMNFTNVTNFKQGVMRYYTTNLKGTYAKIQVWSIDDNQWETYATIGETTNYEFIEQPVFDPTNHIDASGTVQMRMYKENIGNTQNTYYIDWIAIVDGMTLPSPAETDPYSLHRDGSNNYIGNLNITGKLNTTDNITTTGIHLTQNEGLIYNTLQDVWAFRYKNGIGSDNTGVHFNVTGLKYQILVGGNPIWEAESLTGNVIQTGNLTVPGNISSTQTICDGYGNCLNNISTEQGGNASFEYLNVTQELRSNNIYTTGDTLTLGAREGSNNEQFIFDLDSQSNVITLSTDSNAFIKWNSAFRMNDGKQISIGSAATDAGIYWASYGGKSDGLLMFTGTGNTGYNGYIRIVERADTGSANRQIDAGDIETDPTIRIYSSDANEPLEYIDINHNQIDTGKNLKITPNTTLTIQGKTSIEDTTTITARVGINNTNPQYPLHIGNGTDQGAIYQGIESAENRVAGIRFIQEGDRKWFFRLENNETSPGDLRTYSHDAQKYTITQGNDTGNIGINIQNGLEATTELEVNGSTNITNNLIIGGVGNITHSYPSTTTNSVNNIILASAGSGASENILTNIQSSGIIASISANISGHTDTFLNSKNLILSSQTCQIFSSNLLVSASTIMSSSSSKINDSSYTAIIGSNAANIIDSLNSVKISNRINTKIIDSQYSTMISTTGLDDTATINNSRRAVMIAGTENTIENAENTIIIGGNNNKIKNIENLLETGSIIINSNNSNITKSNRSIIINGQNNVIEDKFNTIIIGGQGITANQNNSIILGENTNITNNLTVMEQLCIRNNECNATLHIGEQPRRFLAPNLIISGSPLDGYGQTSQFAGIELATNTTSAAISSTAGNIELWVNSDYGDYKQPFIITTGERLGYQNLEPEYEIHLGDGTDQGSQYLAVETASNRVGGYRWNEEGRGIWAFFKHNQNSPGDLYMYNVDADNYPMAFENDTGYVGINIGVNPPTHQLDVGGSVNITGNITMTSPDGTSWNCGVTNAGNFECN